MYRLLSCCLSLLFLTVSSHATRYHVDLSATGSGTGLSWSNAFTDLQEALGVVIPGDEVWVAAGQYKPTTGTSRTISFVLRNGVNLFGGFSGEESALEQRDIAANTTILSGNIGEPGTATDNTHSVVTANNINTNIIIDGFRIMSGYSGSGSGRYGAGLYLRNALNGNVLVRNCTVVNNYNGSYGGGLALSAANVTLENCDFINNSAGTGGDGGAIYNSNDQGSGSVLTIRDCRFIGNSARVGACLTNSASYASLLIDRCLFTNNTSENSILDIGDFDRAWFLNSAIIGNSVNGFSSYVLVVDAYTPSDLFSMINCTVAHNYNLYTGSIQREIMRFYDTNHVIQNSIIHGNTTYNGRQVSTNVIIANSIVQGGHTNGTAVLDQDPQFSGPFLGTPGNFDASTFDYRVRWTSPAINSGNNDLLPAEYELDLSNNMRIMAGTIDMGCYESDFSTTIAHVETPSTPWYYDPIGQVIRIAPADVPERTLLTIHDTNGRLHLSTLISTNTVGVNLPRGSYVASAAHFGTLKFVVP